MHNETLNMVKLKTEKSAILLMNQENR